MTSDLQQDITLTFESEDEWQDNWRRERRRGFWQGCRLSMVPTYKLLLYNAEDIHDRPQSVWIEELFDLIPRRDRAGIWWVWISHLEHNLDEAWGNFWQAIITCAARISDVTVFWLPNRPSSEYYQRQEGERLLDKNTFLEIILNQAADFRRRLATWRPGEDLPGLELFFSIRRSAIPCAGMHIGQ